MAGSQGNIFSVHVAILMRWGVTIFKMPPSTAATVNQFPNPKVSIVEGEGAGGEGQGGHLLFLIRMDQFSLPPLCLSILGAFFLFLKLSFKLFPPSPPHFPSVPRELNGAEESCHFKMSPRQNKNPLMLVLFSLHYQLRLLVTYTRDGFSAYDPQNLLRAFRSSNGVVAYLRQSSYYRWAIGSLQDTEKAATRCPWLNFSELSLIKCSYQTGVKHN